MSATIDAQLSKGVDSGDVSFASPGVVLSFTDPFTLKAWANLEVAGLPDLVEQVRLFGEHVLPRLP